MPIAHSGLFWFPLVVAFYPESVIRFYPESVIR